MPLPVPNLDDRTFDQLEAEARGLIPRHFPAWTDHNLSDPGVTLMELFTFLTEAAIYQINCVPERSLERFAALVGIARAVGEPIETMLRRALEALEPQYRAVTVDEWERLATQVSPTTIARAKAIVEVVDTPHVFPDEQSVKVIIVPVPTDPHDPAPTPSPALRQDVFTFLRPRRLITTRVRVVAPDYTPVSVAVTLVRDLSRPLDKTTVQQRVEQAVHTFLSPLTGGVDGNGWEFGRSVFRSELYQIIEGIPGVDHVQQLLLNGIPTQGKVPLATTTSLVRLVGNAVTVIDP